MGIIPNNTGGFGDAAKAAQVFDSNEINCLQRHFLAINDWMGMEVVKFDPYKLAVEAAAKLKRTVFAALPHSPSRSGVE